jgi:hypothetical protein
MMRPKNLAPSVLLIIALFAQGGRARGPSATDGAIGGTVYESAGNVVAGPQIEVVNDGTGSRLHLAGDGSGYFKATGLQPGLYTVTVTATGFSSYKASGVVVSVGSMTEISATLSLGTEAQVVEVSGASPQVDVESPAIASTMNLVGIDNLPINGRRWSDFAVLTPGATRDPQGTGLTSFRGASSLLNNITIDGADDNQAFFSEERGRSLRIGYSTAQVSVQEFQVNTSNYSAEYGRSAGGVVNTVTKSGTNQFHGEAYFYDRDNDWGAINPYTILTQNVNGTFVTSPYKPKDWRKQTGFGIGGPILKDRLFFFYAFDYYLRNFPGIAAAGVPSVFYAQPSAAQLSVFAQRLGLGTDTGAALTTYNNGLNDLNGLLGTVPRHAEQTVNFPKLDWQISPSTHASFEYNRMVWGAPAGIVTQPSIPYGTSTFGNDYTKVNWGLARLDTAFLLPLPTSCASSMAAILSTNCCSHPPPMKMALPVPNLALRPSSLSSAATASPSARLSTCPGWPIPMSAARKSPIP